MTQKPVWKIPLATVTVRLVRSLQHMASAFIQTRQEALLSQRDRATYFSVELCNYKISLSCGIICVILRLAAFTQYRSVTDTHTQTDGRTDRRTMTAHILYHASIASNLLNFGYEFFTLCEQTNKQKKRQGYSSQYCASIPEGGGQSNKSCITMHDKKIEPMELAIAYPLQQATSNGMSLFYFISVR